MKKYGGILLFLFALCAVLLLHTSKSLAVSGSDWKPGRIIDDVVFQNKSSMTVDQIQQFLNSKVPACDTNGTKLMWAGGPTRAQWSVDNGKDPAPYTCLKDYVENPTTKQNNAADPAIAVPGGLSAAQLIYNAAQAQNVNPQVFLVLLQKEQGLVTDDWPYVQQFEKATGNNCPDTAPCNPAYAFLWTQVNNSGAQFNYYVNHFDQYNYAPGWNNILYNPNTGCGRQSIFIENAYTAALYIYTPYVPNQAALNNMYGTGDSCSAYGNRNFWRYFNDWFGSSLTDGYQAEFNSFSGYTSVTAGQTKELWIRYKNVGVGSWRDQYGPVNLGAITSLAITNPINKSSPFASPSWTSSSRIAATFSKVYEADGTTLSSDQHVANKGQIVEYRFTISVPDTMYGTDSLWLQPIREGASNWGMGAIGYFNITATNPSNRAKLTSKLPKPTIKLGQSSLISLSYQNTGTNTMYDYRHSPPGAYPTVLAATSPINRTSTFYDPTWHSVNRPTIKYLGVVNSDSSPASDQLAASTDQVLSMQFAIKVPYGTVPGQYSEDFELVREGAPDWTIPGSKFTLTFTVTGDDQAIQYHSIGGYPTLRPLERASVSIRYINAGTKPLYDASSYSNTGQRPLVLANTFPINRSSHFRDADTWHNYSRPTILFSKVYEKDGITLAANQHIAQPGQILEFSYFYKAPSYAQPATYREWITPVLEGAQNWNLGGAGFFDITVPR